MVQKETACSRQANNYTKWRSRVVLLENFAGPNNDFLSAVASASNLNGIPSSVVEVAAAGGDSGTYKYNCQPWTTTYEETIGTDPTWKQCVGSSSVGGGTSFNKNSSKPSLAFNKVADRAHVAIATGSNSGFSCRTDFPSLEEFNDVYPCVPRCFTDDDCPGGLKCDELGQCSAS